MKTRYFLQLTLLVLTGISCNSLNSIAQQTKNVTVSDFSGVSVSAGIHLYLQQGTTESAKIVADDASIDEVEVVNNNNNLVVRFRKTNNFSNNWKSKSAKVYITYKSLNSISASSGSTAVTENQLKTDHLDASVSSGAGLTLDVACKDLEVQSSSGGSATIKGTAANTDLKVSSGGSIKGLELVSDYSKATASSGGGIKITVNKGLTAKSSSGGNIRYKGTADLDNQSGRQGNVHRID